MFRADMREVMSRRCGLDELNNFIMLVAFIFIVIARFSHKWIFTLIGAALVVLYYSWLEIVCIFTTLNLQYGSLGTAQMKFEGKNMHMHQRYRVWCQF